MGNRIDPSPVGPNIDDSQSMLEKRVLIACFAAHVIGFLFFLKGFFPSKVVLPGFSHFEDGQSPFVENDEAKFDKLVLVVIDALRADFVFSKNSNMHFVHQLIQEDCAVPFTAYSNPPTVTLPRLKGITTGGTPSFIDAVLNIADDKDTSQSLYNQDSWLNQLRNKSKVMNFYGDDTWLKLFPPEIYFDKFEGTNSFFVSDFTEVDNNVTRHISEFTKSEDWDVLILHYLGLDHIGHKAGPNSSFMKAKQEEMDNIIKTLYEKVCQSNTLLVVMGDHGMNEIGNHGGSSSGETNAGLAFISPRFKTLEKQLVSPLDNSEDFKYYQYINQIDLVPTLASLMNFPIPKNNLGVMIKDFLSLWEFDKQLKIVKENCLQFLSIYEAKYKHSNFHEKWESIKDSNLSDDYFNFLKDMQDELTSAATEYDYKLILFGICLLATTVIVQVSTFRLTILSLNSSRSSFVVFLLFTLSYSLHFFASSLIEEEYQVWWLLSSTTLIYFYFSVHFKSVKNFIVILVGLRILRSWCNSGQKYTKELTLSNYLANHPGLLWILNALTYSTIAISAFPRKGPLEMIRDIISGGKRSLIMMDLFITVIALVSCLVSFSFKMIQYLNDGHTVPYWLHPFLQWICTMHNVVIDPAKENQLLEVSIQLSQLSVLCFGILFVLRLVVGKIRRLPFLGLTEVSSIIISFLIHQSRSEIVPMYLVFNSINNCISRIIHENFKLDLRRPTVIICVCLLTLCLQHLSFFSMGNTNLLATVDLSNSYNGIRSYNIVLVGLLTFFTNFAGPIYWSLTSILVICESNSMHHQPAGKEPFDAMTKVGALKFKTRIFLFFYSVAGLFLTISCFSLRFHLFIWTVFSPKLLYFASWSILLNLIFDSIISLAIIAL